MDENILMIAALSRRACENFNEAHGHFPVDLGGACGLASHFLFCNLKNEGYHPVFIMAKSNDPLYGCHCWVRVGRQHIDITASQYGLGPLYYFGGDEMQHKGLRNIYGYRYKNWSHLTAFTEHGIEQLMKSWSDVESYTGIQRKRLDNFYRN